MGKMITKKIYYDAAKEMVQSEAWILKNPHGYFHREGAPATLDYYENGQIQRERWYHHGNPHREEDSPAHTEWFPSGEIKRQMWYVEGDWHREGKPAKIRYDKKGNILEIEFWLRATLKTFWEVYETLDKKDRSAFLRDWLPFNSRRIQLREIRL